MKILSIIPARGGSKGIPLKNLVLVNKKPLLYYSISASKKSKMINRTVVSTDNEKIIKNARKLNAEVIKRPKKLATDKAQIEPVIKHVLDFLFKQEKYVPDIIILLQNTSPLRTSNHIDQALKLFLKGKFDSVFSAYNSHYFLWGVRKKSAFPINHHPNRRKNRQDVNYEFAENGAINITKYSSFMKSKCRISGKIGIYPMPMEMSYEVDSPQDISIIENIMSSK